VISYVRGDLLDPAYRVIAHAISADQAMSLGVAKAVCDVLGRQNVTSTEQPVVGTVQRHVVKTKDGDRIVYNLVGKTLRGDKPTAETINACLRALVAVAAHNKDELVHMPRIFCGLDGHTWDEVEGYIATAFEGKGVRAKVITPDRMRADGSKPPPKIQPSRQRQPARRAYQPRRPGPRNTQRKEVKPRQQTA